MSGSGKQPGGEQEAQARIEQKRESCREYYAAHREQVRAQQHEYYLANRELFLAKRRRQRARDKGRVAGLTAAQWEHVKAHFGWRCVYCGAPETLTERLTLDDVDPLSRGGHHVIGNAAPACAHCNPAKGCRTPEDFIAGLARPRFTAAQLRAELAASALAWKEAADAGGTAAAAEADVELGPPLSLDGVLDEEAAA